MEKENRIANIKIEAEQKERDDIMDSIEKAFGDDNNEIKKEDKREEEDEEKYDEFEIKEKKIKQIKNKN